MQSIPKRSRQGAVRRQWLFPCQGLQRRIERFGKLPPGEPGSGHPRRCASCKGLAIPGETRLVADRFPARCTHQSYVAGVLAKEPSITYKNGDPKAAAIGSTVAGYAFLRRAIPTRPSRPEPNSQTAAGIGTAL